MASAHRLWMLLLVVTVQSTQSATTSGPMTMTTTTTATAPDPNTTATPGPTTTTLPTITNIIALAPPTTPPSAPILNSQNTSSLTLRWTATAAVSYMVQHAVVGGVLSDSLTSRTTVLSATINGLTPGQSYDVVVIAYSGVSDVNGTAGPSAAFTTKPSPPTGLKAAQSTRTITLDWGYATTGDVVHGFSLQCTPSIGGCSNSTWTSVGNGTIRTCTLSNASYGQQYSFSLRAESGAGISRDVFSAVDIVSIEIAAGQPTNLQVVERSRTEVDASWDVPVDAVVAGYRLYWNSTNSGTDGHKDTTTLSTTVDVLDPGYSYEFSVASTTASGSSSSPSSPVTYTAYPSEVTGLDLQTRTSSSLTFTWNFDDTNSRYDDYDYIFSPNMSAIRGAPTNSGDIYTLVYSNLTADSEYTFRVRTRVTDSANPGPKKYSLFSNITDTTDEDSPTPVRNLAITGTTDSSISISWESPEQENGVVIGYVLQAILDTNNICVQSVFFNCTDCQRKNYDYETAVTDLTSQCDQKETSVQYTSNSFLYYTFDNLAVFTRYEIKVFAINTKPPSVASKSAKTGELSPKGIPDVTVGDIDHESISINWTKVSDDEGVIQGYYVSAVVASSGELEISAMVPTPEYTFKPLTPYTEYKIYVLAYNSAENGTSSDNTTASTSQYEPEAPEDLSVKPSARSLTASWNVPSIQNGVIQSYNIRVIHSTTTVYDSNTSNTTVHITDGIKPYTLYTVLARAMTVYPEWGDAEISGPIRSLQTNPEGEPKNFRNVSQTSSSVMLKWEEIDEELRNGVIQGYTLTSTGSADVDLQKEERSHNVTGLDPYTVYRFTLTGYVKIGGQMLPGPLANVSAKTKQAAPERITIENIVRDEWVNDDDIKPTEITFTLTDDISQIFSKEQGEITEYQILVLASNTNDGVVAPQPPISWGKAQEQKDNPQPYAIGVKKDAPDSWRSARKKRAVVKTVPVGVDTCIVGSTEYCNGPLQPSTEYCIYMRGWTAGGYTDSDCVVQKKTKSDITPIIIAVVVVVAVIIILVGVLYVLKKKGMMLRALRPQNNIRTSTTIGLESIGGCNTDVDGEADYSSIPEELVLPFSQDTHESSVMSPQSTSDYDVAVSAPGRDLPADSNKIYVNMPSMSGGASRGNGNSEYETLQNVSTGDEYESLQNF